MQQHNLYGSAQTTQSATIDNLQKMYSKNIELHSHIEYAAQTGFLGDYSLKLDHNSFKTAPRS